MEFRMSFAIWYEIKMRNIDKNEPHHEDKVIITVALSSQFVKHKDFYDGDFELARVVHQNVDS